MARPSSSTSSSFPLRRTEGPGRDGGAELGRGGALTLLLFWTTLGLGSGVAGRVVSPTVLIDRALEETRGSLSTPCCSRSAAAPKVCTGRQAER